MRVVPMPNYPTIDALLRATLALNSVEETKYRPVADYPEIWDERRRMLQSLIVSYQEGEMPR